MIILALGSNMPGRFEHAIDNIFAALEEFKNFDIQVIKTSNFYKTRPVPDWGQSWFVNGVVGISTTHSSETLIATLQEIETKYDRERLYKNSPRTLDLDIIDYNGQVKNEEVLTLPHPRVCERSFVLIPLRDIMPDWVHPVNKKSLDELISRLPKKDVDEMRLYKE